MTDFASLFGLMAPVPKVDAFLDKGPGAEFEVEFVSPRCQEWFSLRVGVTPRVVPYLPALRLTQDGLQTLLRSMPSGFDIKVDDRVPSAALPDGWQSV